MLVLSTVTLRFFAYYYYCRKGPQDQEGQDAAQLLLAVLGLRILGV